MKKNIILLATAAIVASCSSNDAFKEIKDSQTPIIFTSYAQPATKAVTENNDGEYAWSLNNHHHSFDVWGFRTNSTNQNTWVFTKQLVEYNSSWSYTPARYWDKNADSYTFYAAAPNDAKWALLDNSDSGNSDKNPSYTDNTWYLTYTGYTLTDHDATTSTINTSTNDNYAESFSTAASGKDLMIADDCPWAKANFGKTVNLNFIHILSRLNVIIQRGEDLTNDDVLKLIELKVFGFKSAGNFKENTRNASNAKPGTETRWSTLSGSINYTSTYATSSSELEVKYDANNNHTHEGHNVKQYVLQSLVIPQPITFESIDTKGKKVGTDNPAEQAYLYVKYSITNNSWSTTDKTETFEGYYNLAAAFNASSTNTTIAFNEGWQNNLTIKVNPNTIDFTPMVSEWSNNVEYTYSIR